MSYYARNPHDDAGNDVEATERRERAEAVAGDWFAYATRPQHAAYHQAMRDLRGLEAPRYDRAREAAGAEFKRTTTEAAALCEETIADYLANSGEVSEALAERWEELAARTNGAGIMQAAE